MIFAVSLEHYLNLAFCYVINQIYVHVDIPNIYFSYYVQDGRGCLLNCFRSNLRSGLLYLYRHPDTVPKNQPNLKLMFY
jgi:hypothetical protein